MTVNEGLSYMKALKARHKELVELRGANKSERMYMRETKENYIEKPAYDVSAVDKKVMAVAKEIRLLDAAIKNSNAKTQLADFTSDETALQGL